MRKLLLLFMILFFVGCKKNQNAATLVFSYSGDTSASFAVDYNGNGDEFTGTTWSKTLILNDGEVGTRQGSFSLTCANPPSVVTAMIKITVNGNVAYDGQYRFTAYQGHFTTSFKF